MKQFSVSVMVAGSAAATDLAGVIKQNVRGIRRAAGQNSKYFSLTIEFLEMGVKG